MELILAAFGIVLAAAGTYIAYLQLRDQRRSKRLPLQDDHAQDGAAELEARYRQHLVDSYQYLDFKGIVQLEKLPIRLPLEQVYVQETARISVSDATLSRDRIAGRAVVPADLARSLTERVANRLQDAGTLAVEEAMATHVGVVLLGDPGAGKSTVIKYFALMLAQNRQLGSGSRHIEGLPIVLPVTAYAAALETGRDISLEHYLPTYYREVRGVPQDLSELFHDALQSGRAVVLLDGLDEITDVGRRLFVTRRVEDFYNWYRRTGTRFLVTSRFVGYDEAPLSGEDLEHLLLMDFDRTAKERFATQWTLSFEVAARGDNTESRAAASEERDRLLAAVFANPSVERLASNPLLLTILALIHRQGTELPRRRVELYELYLKTLISSWARARNLDGRPIGPMDEVEAVKLLAPIAYWMHQERPSGTVRRQELIDRISAYYMERRGFTRDEAGREAGQFLNDIRRYVGLMAERGERRFGFLHLSFEEYLASRYIALQGQIDKRRSVELLRQHMHDPVWHEVILLAVGYTSIIAKEEEVAALFVAALLGQGPPWENAGEGLLLAAECLRDVGVEGVGTKCWERVRRSLAEFLEDRTTLVASRWRAGSLLSIFPDPRLDGFELSPEMVDVKGEEFVMGTPPEVIGQMVDEVMKVDLPENMGWVRDYWRLILESETPQHTSAVGGVRISRYPITNSQYKAFLDDNPSYAVPQTSSERAKPYSWDPTRRRYPEGRANHSVVLVSWDDCMAYCRWLSNKTGRKFRLPTEAEWEHAVRGSDGRSYPWGHEWDPRRTNTAENGAKETVAIGCYPDGISPFNVADCVGHVWEWTSTAWGDTWQVSRYRYPYDPDDGREDVNVLQWRLVRGGSWDDVAAFARCASRGPNLQNFCSHYIGFRIAEDIPLARHEKVGHETIAQYLH